MAAMCRQIVKAEQYKEGKNNKRINNFYTHTMGHESTRKKEKAKEAAKVLPLLLLLVVLLVTMILMLNIAQK